jgi:putative tricarboxylic transport membrane protein
VSERGSTPRDERRPDRAALAIALLLLALAAVVAWDVATMRAGAGGYSRIGPRAFPYVIAAGLAVLAVLVAFEGFRTAAEPRERDDVVPMAWIVGGLVAQLALLRYAGFSLATGAVFAATARAFGRGPLWLTYPIGVAFSLAVWLFFARGLQLVLPAGPLERLF